MVRTHLHRTIDRAHVDLSWKKEWFAVQTDNLTRRRHKPSLKLSTNLRKSTLEPMYLTLPKGLRKGQPLYWQYLILEAAIVGVMGMALVEAVWPWLSEMPTHASLFRAMGSVVAFATSVLSWNYVKDSNRAAARAIQAEIKRCG